MDGFPLEQSFQHSVLSLPDGDIPWFDRARTVSTMDDAAEMVRGGIAGWTVVTAGSQRSGRGTRGRDWSSPSGKGLWMSLILPPPGEPDRMEGLPLKAAEAMKNALYEVTGTRFDIKHPNDLMSRGRKLAGIMVETVTLGENIISVILGLGLDISAGEEDFRDAHLPEATSLLIETGCTPGRREIMEAFLRQFKPVYTSLVSDSAGRRPVKSEVCEST
jgi:BirA family biotin operon repressor/biotin-[acetyl-CoA-carboxylase] ligase